MDRVSEIIAELKAAKHPLYLFGKGTTTVRVIDFLQKQSVDIKGVLVNRDYHTGGVY